MITNLEYIPKTEISIDAYEDAVELARILLKNGYAVLLTSEDDITIINYIWAEGYGCNEANRNNVVFCSIEDMHEYEEAIIEEIKDDNTN